MMSFGKSLEVLPEDARKRSIFLKTWAPLVTVD
jgi:hypothetical protein